MPVGDVDALREAIARLAADPGLAARLGALGEARARARVLDDGDGRPLRRACCQRAAPFEGSSG